LKTQWDYTSLADAYLNRPDYSNLAIDAILSIAGIRGKSKVCDVGAGVAHLTIMLARRDLDVVAVEPNDAMRAHGIKRTEAFHNVSWNRGTGEATRQASQAFEMVTFGSSFNVCDRQMALEETARILQPGGWFACLWNHRQLDDPVQSQIERIIKENIPGYGYGTRREDQTSVIDASGLFGPVVHVRSSISHIQTVNECVEAWRSHATLERQAGKEFSNIIHCISNFLGSLDVSSIAIPYSTNIWMAQRR
jgi:ubiquinone/menaquinone biosynthesis C-methylase UbiE